MLVGRKHRVEFPELLLGVEFVGDQEYEMRRGGRNLSAELVGVFVQPVRADCDVSLEIVPYEINLLDVPFEEHLLYLGPFYFLRVGSAVVEKQPTDAKNQDQIQP